MIKFECPHCDQRISAEPEWAGKESECPSCSGYLVVPFLSTVEDPELPKGPSIDAGSNGIKRVYILVTVALIFAAFAIFGAFELFHTSRSALAPKSPPRESNGASSSFHTAPDSSSEDRRAIHEYTELVETMLGRGSRDIDVMLGTLPNVNWNGCSPALQHAVQELKNLKAGDSSDEIKRRFGVFEEFVQKYQ